MSYLFIFLTVFLVFLSSLSAQSQPNWEKLEGCIYKADQWNDGDSFHVLHNGKEYIFRLYFVDTPEDNDRFPERNSAQAAYFGITTEHTLEIGKDAALYTERLLSEKPFTVWKCGQDALGSSNLPREYAFIEVGGRFLQELLVKNGLARIYGKRITPPGGDDSRKYREVLFELENDAKARKVGAWK